MRLISTKRRARHLWTVAVGLLGCTSAYSTAYAQVARSARESAEIGLLYELGGDWLADGYAGVAVSTPLRRWQRLNAGLSVSALWPITLNSRPRVNVTGPPDTSYISSLQRVAAELRWELTKSARMVVNAGVSHGAWRDLPTEEARRPAVLSPFWMAGVGLAKQHWSVEAALVEWRNVASAGSAWAFETSLRRRF